MTQKPRNEGALGSKTSKNFPGGVCPPDPPRCVCLRRSFMKSVSMCSRSPPGTCWSTAQEVGPSDTFPVIFQKSGTIWMNEPLEATGNVGFWIHLGHADNIFFPNVREQLKILAVLPLESTEGWSGHFFCIRRIYTWLRNAMIAERLSDLAVIAGHLCKCSYHRRLCFWPTRLVGYFFTLYFFYFAAFQEFTMLQSPNRMLWTKATQLEIN